jgi:hypothetical protein
MTKQLVRRELPPFHMRVWNAIGKYVLSFHELKCQLDILGMEDEDLKGVLDTLVKAGYVATFDGHVFCATSLQPPRTIDDDWQV